MEPVLDRDPAREATLRGAMSTRRIGRMVYAYGVVASTMDLAHGLAAADSPEGTLICAAEQLGGRGRQGRRWVSAPGGFYCSVILRPQVPLERTPQLALVAGLAAAEAVQSLTGLVPWVRWPNDLLLSGRKVGGTLVEARGGAVAIGQGINVTAEHDLLPDTATSLAASGAEDIDLVALTAAWCGALESWYDRWIMDGFEPIRQALRSRMAFFGDPIHLQRGEGRVEGTAADLDEAGRLVVRLDSGILQAFEMGEVTVLR
jgi:BirA family biotin operon repressor/biotin-[acetyl-CoA-carboxylase] ligase